jgi:hypothetical protein
MWNQYSMECICVLILFAWDKRSTMFILCFGSWGAQTIHYFEIIWLVEGPFNARFNQHDSSVFIECLWPTNVNRYTAEGPFSAIRAKPQGNGHIYSLGFHCTVPSLDASAVLKLLAFSCVWILGAETISFRTVNLNCNRAKFEKLWRVQKSKFI